MIVKDNFSLPMLPLNHTHQSRKITHVELRLLGLICPCRWIPSSPNNIYWSTYMLLPGSRNMERT